MTKTNTKAKTKTNKEGGYDPSLEKIYKSFGPVEKSEHGQIFAEIYTYAEGPQRIRLMERGKTKSEKAYTSTRMKGMEPELMTNCIDLLKEALDFYKKGK